MDTNELEQYAQAISNDITSRRNIKPITIQVKNIQRGHARIRTRSASIPKWSYSSHNLEHFTYYVIHEVTHFITGYYHDNEFKKVEIYELSLWNLTIEYNRAYPHKLYANGQVCFTGQGKLKTIKRR